MNKFVPTWLGVLRWPARRLHLRIFSKNGLSTAFFTTPANFPA
jgi:hypothetical protein